MHLTDEQILALFHDEDSKEKAFGILVHQYQEKIYWQIRRIVLTHEDANDVMQNVFIKVWKGLHNFRADAQLYTWLFRIATNESLTFIKKEGKHNALALESSDDDEKVSIGDTLKADGYFDGSEAELKLQEAIATLPEKQRLVFNMKYFENQKYNDMAVILETSVGALKASYHHAVKKIENYLAED